MSGISYLQLAASSLTVGLPTTLFFKVPKTKGSLIICRYATSPPIPRLQLQSTSNSNSEDEGEQHLEDTRFLIFACRTLGQAKGQSRVRNGRSLTQASEVSIPSLQKSAATKYVRTVSVVVVGAMGHRNEEVNVVPQLIKHISNHLLALIGFVSTVASAFFIYVYQQYWSKSDQQSVYESRRRLCETAIYQKLIVGPSFSDLKRDIILGKVIPRKFLVDKVASYLTPGPNKELYITVVGEHGVGKTTVIQMAVLPSPKGIIYINVPMDSGGSDPFMKVNSVMKALQEAIGQSADPILNTSKSVGFYNVWASFFNAASKFKKIFGVMPVIIIDNAHRLAVKHVEMLQDYATEIKQPLFRYARRQLKGTQIIPGAQYHEKGSQLIKALLKEQRLEEGGYYNRFGFDTDSLLGKNVFALHDDETATFQSRLIERYCESKPGLWGALGRKTDWLMNLKMTGTIRRNAQALILQSIGWMRMEEMGFKESDWGFSGLFPTINYTIIQQL